MPALAEKTVDRASKLAPDVAEGPAASAELEAPTADEDLAGNGASIEAMMEAEPDDGGADGGGILDAMMGGGGSGADAPADAEPAAERELPDVGEGRVQSDEDDEWVVDLAGRRVRPGVQVVWRGEIWTVRAVDVTDSAEEEFSIDVERDGEEEELEDHEAFAVIEGASEADLGLDEDGVTELTDMGGAGQSDADRQKAWSSGSTFADSVASGGTALPLKQRTHTDDVYKERGIADAATHRPQDQWKRWAIPKKLRAKLWSDAQAEFDGLDGAKLTEKAPKYRKMMVRAVERLDDYALQIETARAGSLAHYHANYDLYQQAESAGDTATAKMHQDAMATLQGYLVDMDASGPQVHRWADETHDQSQEVVHWSDQVALLGKSDAAALMRGEDLAAEEEKYHGWVEEALKRRTLAKKSANTAHAVTRGIRDDAIYGMRSKSFLRRKARRVGKDASVASKAAQSKMKQAPVQAASWMTGGLIDIEEREVDGGAATKSGLNFNTWKTSFQRVKAECETIEADALYGSHTGLYTTLKMLTDFGIPTLQAVLKALMLWGAALGLASLGVGLTLTATAGTILLVVTGLKGALELVLALWSAKKVEDYTDRDARKKKHAKAERWKHGSAAAADLATTAAMGSASTTRAGKSMSPDKALKSRFTDFENADKRSDGSVGTGKAGRKLGLAGPARDAASLAPKRFRPEDAPTPGVRSPVERATTKVIDATGHAVESGGQQADEERKRRIEPMVDHSMVSGLDKGDRFFSATPVAGPAPTGKAPAPPSVEPAAAEVEAPVEAEAPVEVEAPAVEAELVEVGGPEEDAPAADSGEAAAGGSKVKRMASKVAAGLAKASEKVEDAVPEASAEDPEAKQKAADIADIAADADAVAEALP